MSHRARRFDVICRVIDNFGDAGVALRLSWQLAAEHAAAVTLWIDDVGALSRLLGDAVVSDGDCREGVHVRALESMTARVESAEVVIEAFGCGIPDRYLDAMERAPHPPVWIVLEYLSAEPWIDGANALPSPHPTRALRRWFVFPGFTPASGGLLRERSVLDDRRRSERSARMRSDPWTSLGFPAPDADALVVTLFCYPHAPMRALLDAWREEGQPIACLIPDGVATKDLADALGMRVRPGALATRGALSIAVAPFVHQHAFDRRLWGSDLCIVRGEDSFVRAQWAARPHVWHIYPQADGVHIAKLNAFIDRYAGGLDAAAAHALRDFWIAFNEADAEGAVLAWPAFRRALPSLRAHATTWANALARQRDLASYLVQFAQDRL